MSRLCVAAVFTHREEEESCGLRGHALHPVLHPAPHVHHFHRLQYLLWPLQRLRLLRKPRPPRVSVPKTRLEIRCLLMAHGCIIINNRGRTSALEEKRTSDEYEPYSLQQRSQNISFVALGGRQPDRQKEPKGVEREQIPGPAGEAA